MALRDHLPGTSCWHRYLIAAKPLGRRFGALTTTAYCYVWAAACMWAAGLAVDYDKSLFGLICADCPPDPWAFPRASWPALGCASCHPAPTSLL